MLALGYARQGSCSSQICGHEHRLVMPLFCSDFLLLESATLRTGYCAEWCAGVPIVIDLVEVFAMFVLFLSVVLKLLSDHPILQPP